MKPSESLRVKSANSAGQEKPKKEKTRTLFHRDEPSTTGLLTMKGRTKTVYCIFCDRNYLESARYEQGKKMNLPQRQECVEKKFACFNCLNKRHSYKYCRVKVKCPWCSGRHVILMYPNMLKEVGAGEYSEENVEKTIIQFGKCNLLRFGKGKIGVISDIKKVFLQITINIKDRDFYF